MPYIFRLESTLSYFKIALLKLKNNIWLLYIHDNNPIAASQTIDDFEQHQVENNTNDITIVVCKRNNTDIPTKILIHQHWEIFNQISLIQNTTDKQLQYIEHNKELLKNNNTSTLIKYDILDT